MVDTTVTNCYNKRLGINIKGSDMVKLGFTREEIMSSLQQKVEDLYKNCDTWLEAVAEYCQEYDLEETEVIPYLSPVLLERLRSESVGLKRIKTENIATLPF